MASRVAFPVEMDAEELKAPADLVAKPGRVFADPAGEDQPVEPAKRGDQDAGGCFHWEGVDVQGEFWPALPIVGDQDARRGSPAQHVPQFPQSFLGPFLLP